MPLTSQELQSKLWQAADILRGQIDSADYKNYIFSILFLKRLSDRFDEEVEGAVSTRGVPLVTALTDRDEHEFFVPEDARWSVITGKAMGLGEALNVASFALEDANRGRLDGVLTGVNWNDEQKLGSPANRESLIRQLLNHFAGLDLRDANLRDGQLDFTQNPGKVMDDITFVRSHWWLVAEGFSLSTANSDVQKLPATLYHRIADSLAYAA